MYLVFRILSSDIVSAGSHFSRDIWPGGTPLYSSSAWLGDPLEYIKVQYNSTIINNSSTDNNNSSINSDYQNYY